MLEELHSDFAEITPRALNVLSDIAENAKLYLPFLLSNLYFSLALFPLLRNLNGTYKNSNLIF